MRHAKILLVDHQVLVRHGIRSLLEKESGYEVFEAGSVGEALECAEQPDIILFEPAMDKRQSSAAISVMRERFPMARVVVLTVLEDPMQVHNCLSAGASGYTLKKAGPADLIEAVRRVAGGGEYLHPSVGIEMIKRTSGGSIALSHGPTSLTQTDRDVLRMLALGHTNAEVASILSFAVRTVEGYRSRLMDKLGAKTRAELVEAAVEMDLLHLETVPNRNGA